MSPCHWDIPACQAQFTLWRWGEKTQLSFHAKWTYFCVSDVLLTTSSLDLLINEAGSPLLSRPEDVRIMGDLQNELMNQSAVRTDATSNEWSMGWWAQLTHGCQGSVGYPHTWNNFVLITTSGLVIILLILRVSTTNSRLILVVIAHGGVRSSFTRVSCYKHYPLSWQSWIAQWLECFIQDQKILRSSWAPTVRMSSSHYS